MKEFTIRALPRGEYLDGMKKEVAEKGINAAIKERCDKIAETTRGILDYPTWGYVTELLNEIIEILEIKGETE